MPLNFEEFVSKAAKVINLDLTGYKIKRVQRRTDSLMRRHNINSYDECLGLMITDPNFKETYINHFTINTSEFFRNPKNYDYLRKKILPVLFHSQEQVNFWSAPCSNGSEPYTLAIILNEEDYSNTKYKILASDLDSSILSIAHKGIFGENSLQSVDPDLLQKYFTLVSTEPERYQLSPEVMKKVSFEKKDLIKEPFRDNWDMIFCRNFFIYLTTEIKELLIKKFISSLKSGGYFFVGNTEFIFTPEKYGLKKIHSSFYRKF